MMNETSPFKEPVMSKDRANMAKKALFSLAIIVITVITVFTLKRLFPAVQDLKMDFGWLLGIQFLMLWLDVPDLNRLPTWRIVLGVIVLPVVVTSAWAYVQLIS